MKDTIEKKVYALFRRYAMDNEHGRIEKVVDYIMNDDSVVENFHEFTDEMIDYLVMQSLMRCVKPI